MKKEIEDESIHYGLLIMVVCDVWFSPASYHDVRLFRMRHKMSKWFRFLTENFEFIVDKQEKSKRQIVEVVNSQIKNFNLISRWRKVKTFVAYLYAYAFGIALEVIPDPRYKLFMFYTIPAMIIYLGFRQLINKGGMSS